jgi:hypothetical protein
MDLTRHREVSTLKTDDRPGQGVQATRGGGIFVKESRFSSRRRASSAIAPGSGSSVMLIKRFCSARVIPCRIASLFRLSESGDCIGGSFTCRPSSYVIPLARIRFCSSEFFERPARPTWTGTKTLPWGYDRGPPAGPTPADLDEWSPPTLNKSPALLFGAFVV